LFFVEGFSFQFHRSFSSERLPFFKLPLTQLLLFEGRAPYAWLTLSFQNLQLLQFEQVQEPFLLKLKEQAQLLTQNRRDRYRGHSPESILDLLRHLEQKLEKAKKSVIKILQVYQCNNRAQATVHLSYFHSR
jgi:hypothetical protein